MKNASWIWSVAEPTLQKSVCLFRKSFLLKSVPEHCLIQASADSIYRLYVNEQFVLRESEKSDRFRRFYETKDIAPYLKPGKNVIAVFACHFINDEENSRIFETGPIAVQCSLRGGFILGCDALPIQTDASWLVHETKSVQFRSPYLTRYATDMLDVDLREYPYEFIQVDYDDSIFHKASIVTDSVFERFGGITTWPLIPSRLPSPEEVKVLPKAITRHNVLPSADFLNGGACVFTPGCDGFIEIDMGELTTAHLELWFEYNSDKPVPVSISYAESYFRLDEQGGLYKGIRDDCEGAIFNGEEDRLQISSRYGKPRQMKFETVFYRTFRFLRLFVAAAHAPVIVKGLKITSIMYPLRVQSDCVAPPVEKRLWDVSLRTLRLCMHTTYEDCPYYEQMQYTMDTALQMKYSYYVSTDDRLARNAIDAFSAARMPDGLVPCTAPAKFYQVIPGFSMFFIEMLYDHFWHYADVRFLRRYLCVADSIIQYFIQKIDPDTGLFPRSEYWEFTDWVAEWHHNFGVPISKSEPIHTIYHEMLVYFLKKAAFLNNEVGRSGTASEYLRVAGRISDAVLKHCYDENRKLFTDTVGRADASMHAQFWAVLAEIVTGEESVQLMSRTMSDPSLFSCSYSMTYYLLRALEMTGLYNLPNRFPDQWLKMLDLNMSTWSEDPVTQRSDCHGWSSLPIYEFCALTLGIRPASPGFEKILIQPYMEKHSHAEGVVASVKGPIYVKWEKTTEGLFLEANTPLGIPVQVMVNGQTYQFHGGNFNLKGEPEQ